MHILAIIVTLPFLACTTVYYNFWETLGQEKRDLLKRHIAGVKNDQNGLEEKFKDTLSKIRDEYEFSGGKLEKTYDKLSADYNSAEQKSNDLSERINRTERIAKDLFQEWNEEAQEISNPQYRRDSLQKRKETMEKFDQMLASMRRVEKSIEPILTKFKDQVLYIKHNLNAQALGAFKKEFLGIETEINKLIKEMEMSTKQADQFISEMN